MAYPEIDIPPLSNLTICVSTGNGGDGGFSCLITNEIPDLNMVRSGQCFPMYLYKYEDTDTDKKERA